MKRNPKLVLYEPDQTFAARICDYWINQKGFPFEVTCFSNYEKWHSAYPQLSADVWLIDSSIAQEAQEAGLSGRILIWTDDESQETAIYKYRSADILMQTLKDCLDTAVQGNVPDRDQTCVLGMYTPIKSELQTVMGMEIARVLAAYGQVLYLPLTGFWALKDLQPDYYSKDISDFMYFLARSEQQSTILIQNYILEQEGIELLAAVDNPDSLRAVTSQEWLDFLDFWKKTGRYQYVLLDIGPEISEIPKLLQGCTKVFAVRENSNVSERIWRQYEQYLEATGNLSLMARTEIIRLPERREDFDSVESSEYKHRIAMELLSQTGVI
ncbi:MAG: hypothetical protein LUH58_08150 [Lachnospiraceae bacterium]|nr:hypothetical protein [Lachnospiraceae bacterium]